MSHFIHHGLFASESVSEGHPDKVSDAVSDLVLDKALEYSRTQGTQAATRVACETLVYKNTINIAGEISLKDKAGNSLDIGQLNRVLNIEPEVKQLIKSIGYQGEYSQDFDVDHPDFNFSWAMEAQSSEIANLVDGDQDGDQLGAGDQGLMFGFACTETPALMPMPIFLAHWLTAKLTQLRNNGSTPLGPDAKSQVVVAYEQGKPVSIRSLVISSQHTKDIELGDLRGWIEEELLQPHFQPLLASLGMQPLDMNVCKLNFKGAFVKGGPAADTGLTGRKIIVDTYGGYARHGGGAFSGKDPSKVDRSAAYALRWAARRLVQSGICSSAEVQLAYVIGDTHPLMIDGTLHTEQGKVQIQEHPEAKRLTSEWLNRPLAEILDSLKLWDVRYQDTTNYGHFGREGLPWES